MGRRAKQPPTPQGKWIRQVREWAELRQLDFAERLGVERVTVANWERGKFKPEWGSIEKVMKMFPDAPPPPFQKNNHVPGRQRRQRTISSLIGVVEDWGREVGEPELMDDDEFARALVDIYTAHRKRMLGRSPSPKAD